MKQYEDGAEFESSKHLQKKADKERLKKQREQKIHDNNRNRFTRFEFDEEGRGHTVFYINYPTKTTVRRQVRW